MKKILRIGTRTSPLALIQAQLAKNALIFANPDIAKETEFEIVPIKTSGDWRPESGEQSFLDMEANKGLFTKEIEEALLEKAIDFAIHSMKDVSVWNPKGLEFSSVLEREDARDAFLSPVSPVLDDLPRGAKVGTSSLRRAAQLLARRPDLKIVPLRGNVDTRLRKLADGDADATILAVAGLKRLGAMEKTSSILSTEVMLPAAAQGALGIETRADDDEARKISFRANCEKTHSCVLAERAVLRALDGSCRTPIAAFAVPSAFGGIRLEALASKRDGSKVVRKKVEGKQSEAEKIGAELGEEIKKDMPQDF